MSQPNAAPVQPEIDYILLVKWLTKAVVLRILLADCGLELVEVVLAVVQILVAQGLPTCIAHARVSHHTRKPQATPMCTALVACARFNRWE